MELTQRQQGRDHFIDQQYTWYSIGCEILTELLHKKTKSTREIREQKFNERRETDSVMRRAEFQVHEIYAINNKSERKHTIHSTSKGYLSMKVGFWGNAFNAFKFKDSVLLLFGLRSSYKNIKWSSPSQLSSIEKTCRNIIHLWEMCWCLINLQTHWTIAWIVQNRHFGLSVKQCRHSSMLCCISP